MKIFNIIKRAIISLSSKDNEDFQIAQATYFEKTKNIELILPYGLYSNAKTGAISLVFAVNGQEENLAGIPYNPYVRFKNLNPSEVAVGNPHKLTKIYFKDDGNIDIETSVNVNIKASKTNLGVGGKAIARVDDIITGQVIIPSGSSAGTYNITNGKISTGSPNNTSI